MVFSWLILSLFFLVIIDSLLMALLSLELMGLFLFFYAALSLVPLLLSSSFMIVLFSVFVIGGVVGLSSLIVLVSFTGLDYLSSSSVLNF